MSALPVLVLGCLGQIVPERVMAAAPAVNVRRVTRR